MLKLIKHTTVLVQSLFSLGSVVDVLPTSLKKADFLGNSVLYIVSKQNNSSK